MRKFIVLLALMVASPAVAADKAGCANSDFAKRFPDADLIDCASVLNQETTLMVKPSDPKTVQDDLVKVSGAIETRVYANPPERSALEINRYYEAALLTAPGAQILFSCARDSCGGYGAANSIVANRLSGMTGDYAAKMRAEPGDVRYVAVRFKTDKGNAYLWVMSVYSAQDRRAYSIVRTVVSSNAPAGPIVLSAAALTTSLGVDGHVAVYSVQFEPDKANLLPASWPQLDEVVKLLKNDAELKILIACHTDGTHADAAGIELSRKRAEAVKDGLVKAGINANRLSAQGIGAAAPLTSNHDEAGRSRNRRVELVERLN